VRMEGGDLILTLTGSSDAVRIANYFSMGPMERMTIQFADGAVWDGAAVDRKLALSDDFLVGTVGNDTLDGGQGNDTLLGMDGNDVLIGDGGNDLLDGGMGADQLHGGQGNDTYVVDAQDTVVEWADAGVDTVMSASTYTLGDNVENLTLIGLANANGTGNALRNTLTGNDANNVLDGGAGADALAGGLGDDTYVVDDLGDVVTELAGAGVDTVVSGLSYTLGSELENLTLTGSASINGTGNALNNVLLGNAGANTLDGGAGGDLMAGGAGNDVYLVDALGDNIIENAAEGSDTVRSLVSLTLGNNVENLTLLGASGLTGTGNTLNNVLTGNNANNVLTGNAGDDWLDGGLGNDTLVGGLGNDTYVVNASGDVVTDAYGEGIDTVLSSVTRSLGSNTENLTLTGTAHLNGTGNSLNNVLTGNAGNNQLSASSGADTLDGGAGTDMLIGGTGADTYVFGRGYGVDTVQENDATSGVRDSVRLGAGITQANMRYQRVGDNLEASILGTTDKLVFQSWYQGSRYHVEDFRFSDGSVLTDTQVQALVGAMATFTASSSGSSNLIATPTKTAMQDLAASSLI
jgi:Ca2+-binding RTX toxin-like protein